MSVTTTVLMDTKSCHNRYSSKYTVTNAAMCVPSAFVLLWVYFQNHNVGLKHTHAHTHTQYIAICHYNELESRRVYLSIAVLTILNTHTHTHTHTDSRYMHILSAPYPTHMSPEVLHDCLTTFMDDVIRARKRWSSEIEKKKNGRQSWVTEAHWLRNHTEHTRCVTLYLHWL